MPARTSKQGIAWGTKAKASSPRTRVDFKDLLRQKQTKPLAWGESGPSSRKLRPLKLHQDCVIRPCACGVSSERGSRFPQLSWRPAGKRPSSIGSLGAFDKQLRVSHKGIRQGAPSKRTEAQGLCRASPQATLNRRSTTQTRASQSHISGETSRKPRKRLGKPVHAVRVEDLSPAAPQPENEEAVDVKVPVGFVGERTEQVFTIRKVLPAPSVLLTVTLPKPLGIIFEESRIRKRVVVADLLPGGNAERAARVVQMFGPPKRQRGNTSLVGGAVQRGDLLRGLTTTQCIVDLFGVRAPRRATVYFDTEYRRWGEIMGAFSAVKVSDGEITLVLERKLERSQLTA